MGALWPAVKSLASTGLCGFGATHRANLNGTARAFHPAFVPPFIRLSSNRQNRLTAWVLGFDRQGERQGLHRLVMRAEDPRRGPGRWLLRACARMHLRKISGFPNGSPRTPLRQFEAIYMHTLLS